jgi:hypothetical protein
MTCISSFTDRIHLIHLNKHIAGGMWRVVSINLNIKTVFEEGYVHDV